MVRLIIYGELIVDILLQIIFVLVTEYFKGNNWKINPDWVYCEYNSLKDLEKDPESAIESSYREKDDNFDTPEEQVLHFLARAGRPGWKWMSVR